MDNKERIRKEIKEAKAELQEYGIGTTDDFFAKIKRKAWAFGYNEPEVMLCVGQLMLCKLYDEQYAAQIPQSIYIQEQP